MGIYMNYFIYTAIAMVFMITAQNYRDLANGEIQKMIFNKKTSENRRLVITIRLYDKAD